MYQCSNFVLLLDPRIIVTERNSLFDSWHMYVKCMLHHSPIDAELEITWIIRSKATDLLAIPQKNNNSLLITWLYLKLEDFE